MAFRDTLWAFRTWLWLHLLRLKGATRKPIPPWREFRPQAEQVLREEVARAEIRILRWEQRCIEDEIALVEKRLRDLP